MHLVFSEGERYPMLVDRDGVPDFWVTLFVTENLRPSLMQTTIENTIRDLIHLSRTSRNQKGNTKPRSCARFLDVQPIYVPANVLGLTKRKFVTHWV